MIERLQKPLKFDNDCRFLIVARDGEKFYVAKEDVVAEDPNMELVEMGARPLLNWAIEADYPLRKFVRLQRFLVEKFLGV